MATNVRHKLVLKGTLQKVDKKWELSFPLFAVKVRSRSIQQILLEIHAIFSFDIKIRFNDGGVIEVCTSDSQRFRKFISDRLSHLPTNETTVDELLAKHFNNSV
ncbi:MAG TPA: hypothetical protein VNJ08_03195 [Bacteriovoracaceae bacterium]|nr:hypothetical protein [Bacteriovoracaceae bacterium]